MKLLKLSFLAILMALVVMSCSDDNVVDDSGIGGTDNLPDTKVTIVTTVDGVAQDTTVITKTKDDVTYVPEGYNVSSSYTAAAKLFAMTYTKIGTGVTNFSVSLSMSIDSYKVGTYSFSKGGLNNASYTNTEVFDMPYTAENGSITITDIKELSTNGAGAYYSTGSYEMNYMNDAATPSEISVKVTFEGVPVGFQNTNY